MARIGTILKLILKPGAFEQTTEPNFVQNLDIKNGIYQSYSGFFKNARVLS